jgi:hypothetical protein
MIGKFWKGFSIEKLVTWCQFIFYVYQRFVGKQKKHPHLFSIILLRMEYTLHMRNLIHFSVDDGL